jgi:hypothetical protein
MNACTAPRIGTPTSATEACAKHAIERCACNRRESNDAAEPLAPCGVLNFRPKPFIFLANPVSLFALGHLQDSLGTPWNDALELLERGWRR